MKLCIITHKVKKGDGQGRVNYEVAKEVIRRGHHLTLLASEVAPELAENSQVKWIEIPVQRFPTEFIRNFVFTKKSADWLQKNRADIDLVKVNGAITKTSADVNAVHFVHSSWLRSPVHISRTRRDAYGLYQWLYTALNAHWEKQAFRKANVVVAVSEKVAQELVNIGVPRSRIQVIVNGVDLEEFTPGVGDAFGAAQSAGRQIWGLPENVPLALFAGDIRTTRKNLDTVLYALAKVPHLHLAVVGKIEGSPFPQLAASLGISQRVHFLGYRRDIAAIMQAVDLFVFPSRYEACTLVLLEALASGLPVITATTTGGAELVTPECGVVLSDSDDIDALVAALLSLVRDVSDGLRLRPWMQQMATAARSVAEQHSWNTMAKTYVDLFEEFDLGQEFSRHSPNKPDIMWRIRIENLNTIMANHVPPRIAAARLGVSTKTLERWLKEGKIKGIFTPSGQRRYDVDSVISAGYTDSEDRRAIIIYARVSSRSQKTDLKQQVQFLKSHYPNAELITDIGSGLNFKRKGLQALLDRVLTNTCKLVVVAHKDRLCRFGFFFVAWLCSRQQTEVLVLNQTNLSPEREMVEDILAIIHVFSCRLYGLRKYKKQINEDPDLPRVSEQGT